MSTKKQVIASVIIGSWALLSFIGKVRHDAKRHEKKQRKAEITTWEGEGGNLPPPGATVGATASPTRLN